MSTCTRKGLGRIARAYGGGYGAMLRNPPVYLRSQLIAFFLISVYVKTVEVGMTPEYSGTWISATAVAGNFTHLIAFNAQEILLFSALLLLVQAWARSQGTRAWSATAATAFLGLVLLPALSLTEVLGLAHFAYLLTPLSPQEVMTIAWAPMVISSSNVLWIPSITIGVALVVFLYYLLPPAVVFPRLRQGSPALRGPAWLSVAAAFLFCLPSPPVATARLSPHPVLWLAFGNRPSRAWAALSPSLEVDTVGLDSGRHSQERRHMPTRRPMNVLLLILESTRARSTIFYNPEAEAGRSLLPFRDEMVVFDNVYVPVPTSAHALFSILYGVYPYMGAFWSTSGKQVVADSMAHLFKRNGYTTGFFITSDLNYDDVRSFTAPGFDHVLDVNDWPGQERVAMLPWGRDDRLLIDEVKGFLSSGERPFFLMAMTSNPHHPYAAHQIFSDAPNREDRGSYERLVAYDLDLVAELYAWMKEQGLAEDTLLLVLGDHGEAFGEHAGNFGHAAFLHEENLHIPMWILHPSRLGLPTRISQLGSQIDVRPTVTDILGITDTAPSDVMSLLFENPQRLIAHFTEGGLAHFGIRDRQFSYIFTADTYQEQLFHWQHDPQTKQDLSVREPAILADYRTRLQRWEAQHQAALARVLR